MAKIELHQWYRQYLQLKSAYADTVLFYRLGDFYEVFDDDAKLAAALLDVTLTRKESGVNRQTDEKLYAPMAGMPYRAIENYVARLIGAGYRVAIAEQVSETASSKSDTRPRSVYAGGIAPREQERKLKLVDREVVRIITPGTLVDSSLLQPGQHTYLAAVLAEGEQIGFAFADLSTGEFQVIELHGPRARTELEGELARLQVAEVLVPDDQRLRLAGLEPARARLEHDLAPMTKEERELLPEHERIARRLEHENNARWASGHVTGWQSWRWELATARETLLRQFKVQSLNGFGLANKPMAIRAAGAMMQYILETQRGAAAHISSLRYYTLGSVMFLDPQTRRNLELLRGSAGKTRGSLLSVINYTVTPMGTRLLEDWLSQPLLDLEQLRQRQDAVQSLTEDHLRRAELRDALKPVGDLERVVNRIVQGASVATPRELVRLREALRALPRLAPLVSPATPAARKVAEEDEGWDPFAEDDDLFGNAAAAAQAPAAAPGAESVARVDPFPELLEYLERALDDEPPALLGAANYLREDEPGEKPRRVIRPGFDELIDLVVAKTRNAQKWIDTLEAQERQRTGIKSLKVGYNSVFGYYIELPRNAADQAPPDYVRKQTLVSAERYITDQLKQTEDVVNAAQEKLRDLERAAFERICKQIGAQGIQLLATARLLAQTDVAAGLAEAAVRNRYVRPVLSESQQIRISAGRHPVVERSLDEAFIPNDLLLDAEQRMLIITGPNMSGKSTLMRQVALIVLLAQIGSFVPADAAEIGLVDRIFTRIGAQDDIATGQSTFMVEMTETAAILAQATPRSLVILDEVGRGTSTYDGMAIAQALLEYLHNNPALNCRTLFATHYHELTALEGLLPRIRNFHIAAIEQDGKVVFLHELRRGGADRSYGIHVAEIAGVPRTVIQRANELLAELEQQPAQPKRARSSEPVAAPAQAAARNGARSQQQLALFDEPPNPALEALRKININELTPIEALTRLYELQKLAQQ